MSGCKKKGEGDGEMVKDLHAPLLSTPYYAHFIPGERIGERWEEHAERVAKKAEQFASVFDSGEWGYVAGLIHDIGKATKEFQSYLAKSSGMEDYEGSGAHVNHACVGAAVAEKFLPAVVGRIVSYVVAGHHAGLHDYYAEETFGTLRQMLREGKAREGSIDPVILSWVLNRINERRCQPSLPLSPKNIHAWIRLLYSALVDADYLATEAVMSPERQEERTGFASLQELQERLESFLEALMVAAPDTAVNQVRRAVLEDCRREAAGDTGLYTLTVPTGGGKTLSATAFALRHALLRGKRRIIYVIPYTSIVEQTAAVLADVFGRENVVEHHCHLDPDRETRRAQLATENWDAPIIVTTNVQFFESLYGAKPSRCRKLHNIAKSVVILDEVQLIPPRWLVPCVEIIDALVKLFGTTVVLSSATQPLLKWVVNKRDMTSSSMVFREIVREPEVHFRRLRRVKYEIPMDLNEVVDWTSLAHELLGCFQVLCVVNTRAQARNLFLLMEGADEESRQSVFHLSALMCAEHRSQVIGEIKRRLKMKEAVRVISTQLVEAGVDIDFPVVYRAFCGLDSLLQAAGRCNREGRYQEGYVKLFVTPRSEGLMGKREDVMRELLMGKKWDFDDPYLPSEFFDRLYGRTNDLGETWLKQNFWVGACDATFAFRRAAEEFQMIESGGQRPVVVLFGEAQRLVEELRYRGPSRESFRRLQRYTVNLYTQDIKRAVDGRLIEVVAGVDVWRGLYDERLGLRLPEDVDASEKAYIV